MRSLTRLMLAAFFVAGLLANSEGSKPVSAQDRPAVAAKPPVYRVLLVSTGKGWAALRLKTDTGETWAVENLVWQKVVEPEKLPSGDYDIQTVGLPGADTWEAIRIERGSGRSWYLQNKKWTAITEPR